MNEITGEALSQSSYEGWVAWLEDGSPVFEQVSWDPSLARLIDGGRSLPYRGPAPNCLEWKDVPQQKVSRLELYFFRGEPYWSPYRQPIVLIQRSTPYPFQWIQMKMAGLQVQVGGNGDGQRRTGIQGYKVGYFDPRRVETHLIEVRSAGRKHHVLRGYHPCAPRPRGWGLAPAVLGLDPNRRYV